VIIKGRRSQTRERKTGRRKVRGKMSNEYGLGGVVLLVKGFGVSLNDDNGTSLSREGGGGGTPLARKKRKRPLSRGGNAMAIG